MRVNEVILTEGNQLDELFGIGNWMAYRSGKKDLKATAKNLTREFNTWKGRQGIARGEKPSHQDLVNFFRYKKVSPRVINVIEPNVIYNNKILNNIMNYMAALTLSGGQPVRAPSVAGTGIKTDAANIVAKASGGGKKNKKNKTKNTSPANPPSSNPPQPTPPQNPPQNPPASGPGFRSRRNQPQFRSSRSGAQGGNQPPSGIA